MAEQTIDLTRTTCPNREQRIGSIKAFYGKAADLIKISEAGELRWTNRAFQQAGGCVLTSGISRLATVRNGLVLNHAPIGCASGLYGYREVYNNIPTALGRPPVNFRWISSNLTEEDIIFGGEGKLEATIREAEERYHPEAIFIISSCASGIIGDDIEGVVRKLQTEITARLVPIHCEGFRSQVPQTAFDAFWHGILKYLVNKPEKKQPDLINLVAPFSVTWGDRQELIRLVRRLNLRVNYVPEFATVDELKVVGEAALTVTTCQSYGDYLQKALYEHYGVPYVRSPVPVGIEQTSLWLREIAKHTGRTELVEEVIESEIAAIQPHIDNLKKQLAGQKVSLFVNGGQARALGIPILAAELGLPITGISTLEYDELAIEDVKRIVDRHGDYNIHVAEFQAFEQSAILDELKPDIYTGCPFVGSVYKREAGLARMHSFRSDPSSFGQQFGYRGAVTYGHVILKILRNRSLNKLLGEKTAPPYKAWWRSQAPLSFLRKENADVAVAK